MAIQRLFGLIVILGLFVGINQFFRFKSIPNVKEEPALKTNMSRNTIHKNRLAKEKSPYLLQHADNPVDWYPWGEEAFQNAKRENKPIFLSIGYSTCHWCHVMEHESFENPEIAKILNEYFVSIKVDREERPDLDNIYMQAVMALTGGGGWPMSLFLTPDKKPFFAGTYFPSESRWGQPGLKDVLISIKDSWQKNRNKVLESSDALTQAIQRDVTEKPQIKFALDQNVLKKAYDQYAQKFDETYGGFGRRPKFPQGHGLSFLLRYWKRTSEPNALRMVEKTLTEMAKGGIYDHIGKGFHRYSTDEHWRLPHFEKMLYDQALLSRTYLEAYQATGKQQYADTARAIFDYVLRDMTDPQGGFYSAEDADSFSPEEFSDMTPDPKQSWQRREGAFYVWRQSEIIDIFGKEDGEIFSFYFGVESDGNVSADPQGEFEGKNIFFIAHSFGETAQHFGKSEEETKNIIQQGKEELFSHRQQRPRPPQDDKILVDWNGLMISSLAFGSRVLKEPRYVQAAEQAARFILKNLMRKDGRLLHRYRDGEAVILGTIEDYAFFIHGLIDLYEATFKVEYLKEAKRLTQDMIKFFWDHQKGGFFFTATDAEQLIVRQKEVYDGAIPSGNSVAAFDLIRLARLLQDDQWEKMVEELYLCFAEDVLQAPMSYPQLLMTLDFDLGPSKEIVIAGDLNQEKTIQMIEAIDTYFLPNKVVVLRPSSPQKARDLVTLVPFTEAQISIDGQPTAYICENYRCRLPTTNIDEFKKQLLQQSP